MADIAQQIISLGNDPALCRALLERLEKVLAGRRLRFMEVCGTHTVAIFQSGLRPLLPAHITHLSGPGCPVCVTHESEVALFLDLAGRNDVIIATFGDLLRVPGPDGISLKHARAAGAAVEIVYSPLAALELAGRNPDKKVVFLGIGFETTAPAVAASIISARQRKLGNFFVFSLHKLVAPALRKLLSETPATVDAFLLPGHVATITGLAPFKFLAAEFGKPGAVAGFEPADILLALCEIAAQLASGKPEVVNAYPRAVAEGGNLQATHLMGQVFRESDASWRGLGCIEKSGLAIRPEFADFDAMTALDLALPHTAPIPGCLCGDVLKGVALPGDCPLFAQKCRPSQPVGPCMVSTEGSCAAWYKYGEAIA